MGGFLGVLWMFYGCFVRVRFQTKIQDKNSTMEPYVYTGTGEIVSYSSDLKTVMVVDDVNGQLHRCLYSKVERIMDIDVHNMEFHRKHYRPLGRGLTIGKSKIEGLGLFATLDLEDDISLGVSHYITPNGLIRTPLGGFYNHSDNPNCTKAKVASKWFELLTLRKIKAGEELTVKYTLYSV
jgi:hypothetical protein